MKNNIWNTIESEAFEATQSKSFREDLPNQFAHIIEHSAFYRNKFSDYKDIFSQPHKFLGVFSELPFTTKRDYLDDQLQVPPFGSNLCVDISHVSRIHKTSGTTGRPLILCLTTKDIEMTTEAGARCFFASGLRPGHKVVHCLSYCMWAGGYTDHQSLETVGAAVIPYGVGNSMNLIETIMLLKPEAIHCTPSYMAKLEQLLRENFNLNPRDLGLKLGLFGAEAGLDSVDFRNNLESTWGLTAYNANYGLSDALSMFGAECEIRNGLHFTGQGIAYLELFDPDSGKTTPMEKGRIGELVLTNLHKEAQPLIRYRTGDIVEILDIGRCQCGRCGPRFNVIGRADDMFIFKGVNVFPSAIASVVNSRLESLTGEFQILISKKNPIERFVVRVETREGIDSERIRAEILSSFKELLTIKPELEFIAHGGIERTEGKSTRILRNL